MIKGRCSTCKYFQPELLSDEEFKLRHHTQAVGVCTNPKYTQGSIKVAKSYAYPEDPDCGPCGWWQPIEKLSKVAMVAGFRYKDFIYPTREEAESKARYDELIEVFRNISHYDILLFLSSDKEKREAVIKILTEEI